jgi:hypothetical protein
MARPTDRTDQQAREIGQRQSLFREVNEHIDGLAESLDIQDKMPIFCECGSAGCGEQISMSETEYQRLRRIPTHFAVLRGHEIPAVERVVETNERYVVVEKFGQSAVTAIKLDPRRLR